jgi:hypothetical protein
MRWLFLLIVIYLLYLGATGNFGGQVQRFLQGLLRLPRLTR